MKSITLHITLALIALGMAALACAAPIERGLEPTQAIPTAPTAAPIVPTALPATQPPQPHTSTVLPTKPPVNTATTAPAVSQVTFYFVALEGGGKNGPTIGCGDSLVAVTQPVTPTTQPVQAALQALFAVKEQYYGQSGLYNALYQSNLVVDSVNVLPSGVAEVALSGQMLLGGVCDSPRFKAQIEQTIMAQPGVSAVNVTINGKTMDQVLSEK